MLKKLFPLLCFAFSFFIVFSAKAQLTVNSTSPSEGAVYSVGDAIIFSANAAYIPSAVSSDPQLPYLKVCKPSGAWRKLRLGYSSSNLWSPLQNVTLSGNNKLELTLKDMDGNIQWNKVEIHPQGNTTTPVVLGNYITGAENLGNGWLKLVIPLTAFNAGINFSSISFLELPYSTDPNTITLAISRVVFTGGSTPFEWFGATKNDNIHNGVILAVDNMLASLVTTPPASVISNVSFFANGILVGEDNTAPYSFTWSPANSGNYEISSVALTTDNISATSASVNIVVNPAIVITPPVVSGGLTVSLTSPGEGMELASGNAVSLEASAAYTPSIPTSDPNFPYLKISKPSGAWRKLRLGYSNTNLWGPMQNVTLTGNNKVELTLKDIDGNIQWNKVEFRPQGNTSSPVVLGDYIANALNLGNGWIKLVIPLTAFNSAINFSSISYLELPFSTDANTFTLAVSRVIFTGGSTPFEWFGATKNNNIHNGITLAADNMLASLETIPPAPFISKVSFLANGLVVGEDQMAPYSFTWTPAASGSYQLTALALTSDNISNTSAPVNIIVKGGDNPPPPVTNELSVVITFDTPPVNFQIGKASFRFNKKFAYSLTLDDGLLSHYTFAFPVLMGGVAGDGNTYPGLFYTDGCGNQVPFKAGLAWNSVNGSGVDVHTGTNNTYISWGQLDQLYASDWDVLNHGYSHKNRGYNAQGIANPYFPDSVYAYEINQNVSYVKNHTAKGIKLSHFVVPAGDDGYYMPAFNNGMKAVYDQNWALPGNGFGLLVNNALDFNNFKLYRATMADNLSALNSKIDNTAIQCTGTPNRYWFNNFTHDMGTPASTGGVQFATFLANMNYISNTYGKNGNDAMWMAPLQEVYEYLQVKDRIGVNTQWVGNKLYITFDQSNVPADLRRNELTLSVQSNVAFTDVKVTGASQFSFNGTSPDNKLINLSWTSTGGVAPRQATLDSDLNFTSTTGIQENIAVVPNPAHDFLSIRSFNPEEKLLKLSCFNMAGQCLLSEMLTPVNGEMRLSIADLPSGIFFLRIEDNDQLYKIQKFVKQ